MPKKDNKLSINDSEKISINDESDEESIYSDTEQNLDENNEDEIDDDDEEEEEEEEEIIQSAHDDDDLFKIDDIEHYNEILKNQNYINEKVVDNKDRITFDRITKYELVRIIGTRRKQLVMGAKPLIKNTSNLNEKEIAFEELKNRMIPFIISRHCPNGNIEKWKVSELSFDHLINIIE